MRDTVPFEMHDRTVRYSSIESALERSYNVNSAGS